MPAIGPATSDVVVQLSGGLGNQMFQYAFGRAAAAASKRALWLDSRALDILARRRGITARALEVEGYALAGRLAGDHELLALGLDWRVLPSRMGGPLGRGIGLVQSVGMRLRPPRLNVVREPALDFAPGPTWLADHSRGGYFVGYWQRLEYFAGLREALVREFTPRHPLPNRLAELQDQMAREECLVLHVRRGDFATNPSANRFHGVLSARYFLDAAGKLLERVSLRHAFVFTDDPEWCHHRLHLPLPSTLVTEEEYGGGALEHQHVMTAGRAFVISNSTFSWWPAWLSGVPDSHVVAPARWVGGLPGWSGPVPEAWIRVEN